MIGPSSAIGMEGRCGAERKEVELVVKLLTSSMSARGSRLATSRGTGRRKVMLNVDLNALPSENLEEGTSGGPQLDHATATGQSSQQGAPPPLMPIDVDSIEDDVILSSPRAFAEAKNNSRRIRGRRVVDVESAPEGLITRHGNDHNKRHRLASNQQIVNCETYVNSEGSSNVDIYRRSTKDPVTTRPPPPPPEPTFSCPVCMGSLVEEMTTKCGHIFCKKCIKASIAAQGKCPTCRRKVTARDIFRIYLPATN